MFKKVKKWLGIEGVKLELVLPETVKEEDGLIQGKIRFFSMNEQTISFIKIVLIERFSRGRSNDKMTDEYRLGEITLEQEFTVPKEKAIELTFSLPFEMVKSEMDILEDKNLIFSGLVKVAKKFSSVKSEYYVEAEAKATGTALSPFDKQLISIE